MDVTLAMREKGDSRTFTRLFLTDLGPDEASPKQLLHMVRGHWGIENRLHYVRDFTFDEDRCPIRTGNGPRVIATLRSLVIALFRACKCSNIAAALRTLSYRPRQALRLVTQPTTRKTK